jgi:hypothetical protein
MPKPLSKIIPNPPPNGLPFFYDHDAPSKQPSLAVLVAHANSVWSYVDHVLGLILVDILGANATPATAMFVALTPTAQQTALRAAAETVLDEPKKELFKALVKIYRRHNDQRNIFAHWIWAYCELTPDHLVLVDPKRIIEGHAVVNALRHKQITDFASFKFSIPFSDEWMCYSEAELKQVVDQFKDVLNVCRWFHELSSPQSPRVKANALHFLTHHPEIVKEINKHRRKKKS